MTTWYTYKDFETRKIRRTRGKFAGWAKGSNLVGARMACFANRASVLMIPAYLLTAETAEQIKTLERR